MKGDFTGARQFAWFVSPKDHPPDEKFHRGSKPMESWTQLLNARNHHWKHACYQSAYVFDEWKGNRPLATSARLDRIFFDIGLVQSSRTGTNTMNGITIMKTW